MGYVGLGHACAVRVRRRGPGNLDREGSVAVQFATTPGLALWDLIPGEEAVMVILECPKCGKLAKAAEMPLDEASQCYQCHQPLVRLDSASGNSLEFKEAHKHLVGSLAFWMFIFGIAYPVLGIIVTAVTVYAEPKYLFPGIIEVIITLAVGFLTLQTAQKFQHLATSSGEDAVYLMNGLARLRTLFWFQAILVLLGCIMSVMILWVIR
jgi:hypothetical protein